STLDAGGNIRLEVMSGNQGGFGNVVQSGTILNTVSGRLGGNVDIFAAGEISSELSALTFGDRAGNITASAGSNLKLNGFAGLIASGATFGGNVVLNSANGGIYVSGSGSSGATITTTADLASGHIKTTSAFSQTYVGGLLTSSTNNAGDIIVG